MIMIMMMIIIMFAYLKFWLSHWGGATDLVACNMRVTLTESWVLYCDCSKLFPIMLHVYLWLTMLDTHDYTDELRYWCGYWLFAKRMSRIFAFERNQILNANESIVWLCWKYHRLTLCAAVLKASVTDYAAVDNNPASSLYRLHKLLYHLSCTDGLSH